MPKVASQDYRDAMACLGAAVNIVTTDGRAGRAGFTASAVCSVTDNPPTLLVCMNRGSSAYASVRDNVDTHDVLFCRVVALQKSDCADNLIYFGRDYHVVRVGPA